MASRPSSISNTSSSDDSDGGAPLYPDKGKGPASASDVKKETSANPAKPPVEDELALVRASANFGDLNKPNDPFTDKTPQVPRSVPPMTNPFRPHNEFPGNNVQETANQSANRFRGSISSTESRHSLSSNGYTSGMSSNSPFFGEVS